MLGIFCLVLIVCLALNFSSEAAEILSFSTMFGYLMLRRIRRARRNHRAGKPVSEQHSDQLAGEDIYFEEFYETGPVSTVQRQRIA